MSGKRRVTDITAQNLGEHGLYLVPEIGGAALGEHRIGIEDLETWFNTCPYDISEELRNEVRAVAHPQPAKPEIRVTDRHLDELRDEAIAALRARNDPPVFYTQGGYVAEVFRAEDHTHVIRRPKAVRMRERLAEVATWRAVKGRVIVPTKPDNDVAQTLLETPALHLPPLVAITEIPVLRPDGQFTLHQGYDRLARVYFAPSSELGFFRMPERATTEDVTAALRLLDQMLGKFPYKERADKANMLAFMLTPILRPVITGPTPLAAVSAPMPGTGKTLLVESIVRMLIGRSAPLLRLGTDENESEKRITAHLMKGPQFTFLDNVQTGTALDSASLAAVLTATLWSGRRIQTSDMPDLPNAATWVATGNNLTLGPELARRSYLIELDAGMEHPEDRTFDIDLPSWVPAHRRELLTAVMTLVRAWTQVGMPQATSPFLGSFESWSATLGGLFAILEETVPRLSLPFLGNEDRKRAELATDQVDDTTMWLERVYAFYGDQDWTVKELLAAQGPGSTEMLSALPDGINAFSDRAGHHLGNQLRVIAKGSYGGYKLSKLDRDNHRGGVIWQVKRP
jgi:hypothetical protein